MNVSQDIKFLASPPAKEEPPKKPDMKFLASPPSKVDAVTKPGKRSVFSDISNIANKFFTVNKGKNDVNKKCTESKDMESPEQQGPPTYLALEDTGASPIRSALWNDEHAC